MRPKQAIAELGGARDIAITPQKPDVRVDKEPVGARAGTPVDLPVYQEAQATRKAFGEALAALAARPDVVALDGEVANSTHTEDFQKVAPERFFEMYIAEQAMLGAAVGLPGRGQESVRRDVRRLPDARRTTSCAWRRSAARTCGCAARTQACRSARTARRRWRWRTSR